MKNRWSMTCTPLKRFLLPVLLLGGITLLSACTHSGYQRAHRPVIYHKSPAQAAQRALCVINPQECMYDGPYEADEHIYAEEEARRLNRASLERLRRSRY